MMKNHIIILFLMCATLATYVSANEDHESLSFIREAQAEQARGNYKSALGLYSHASKMGADRSIILSGIVSCYTSLGEEDEALIFLEGAVGSDPFDVNARFFLSDEYFKQNQTEKAITELEYIEKLNSSDYRATFKRALIYKKQGQHELAVAAFAKYIANAKPTNYEPYLNRAQSYQAIGKHELAEKDVKKAYDIKKLDEEILVTYASVLQALKKFVQADPLAQQCTDLNTHSLVCWNMRGDIAHALKKNNNAAEYYAKAIQIAPDNYEIRIKLANVYLSVNKFDEADVQFESVLKLKTDHLAALKVWIPYLLKRQNYATAAKVLASFTQNNPRDLWASAEYAKLMNFVGSKEKAVQIMRSHFKANRSDISRMFYAYHLFMDSKFDDAEDELEDIKETSLAANFNLGIVYWKMDEPESAMEVWDKVSADSPEWAKAQVNMALSLERQGKVEKAIEKLTGLSVPGAMKSRVSNYLTYLTHLKNRTPATAGKDVPSDVGYFEWEMPSL